MKQNATRTSRSHKRTSWLIATLLVTIGAGAGTYYWKFIRGKETPPPYEAPLIIGINDGYWIQLVASFSGTHGASNSALRDGLLFALGEFNSRGGVSGKLVRLEVLDDQGDKDLAKKAIEAFASKQDALAVVVGVDPVTSETVVKTAQNEQLTTLVPNALPKSIGEAPSTFSLRISPKEQGQAMANFLTAKLNKKKVAILYDKTMPYGHEILSTFENSFKSSGGTITQRLAMENDGNIASQVAMLLKSGPEALYLPLFYGHAAKAMTAAKKLNFKGSILGIENWMKESPKSFTDLEGGYFTSYFPIGNPPPQSPHPHFSWSYLMQNGFKPTSYTAVGFDIGKLVTSSLKSLTNVDTRQLQSQIAKVKEYSGVTGKINFVEEIKRPLFIEQVVNKNATQTVERVDPS